MAAIQYTLEAVPVTLYRARCDCGWESLPVDTQANAGRQFVGHVETYYLHANDTPWGQRKPLVAERRRQAAESPRDWPMP